MLAKQSARRALCLRSAAVRAVSARLPSRNVPSAPALGRPTQLSLGNRTVIQNFTQFRSFSSENEESKRTEVESSERVLEGAPKEKLDFQAETRQLLDIVTHSLYTDKEVFVRELISNASDALEKARHLQATGTEISDPEEPLWIRIQTDMKNRTLTIEDSGIGMTKAELVSNLGTIARSGSKAFLQELKESQASSADVASGIIGKFGVGFYSAFMVAESVSVFSQSAKHGEPAYCWTSDGSGSYEIAQAEGVKRGSKIVIKLKENAAEFCMTDRVKGIIQKYSNFVSFPIYLDDDEVNTVQAIWAMDKSSLSDQQYTEFYRFIANAYDEPSFRLHYTTDAPLEMKALFFFPSQHLEKFGMARLDPGVSLYSRKVLIEKNSQDILPDWLRFIRGVVDSEDLPLSLSREKMQDSALLRRLREVLTRRIVRFLDEMSRKEPEKYQAWYREFDVFIKEGICTDFQHKDNLAKLLRYETSATKSGESCTLDEYIARMKPSQANIYFLIAPNRALAEASPYFEAFKENGTEVIFAYAAMDDFVLTNIGEYNQRKLVTIERSAIETPEETEADKEAKEETNVLKGQDLDEFKGWLKLTLKERVKEIKDSRRLVKTPAVIVDHQSAAVRRMMQVVNQGLSDTEVTQQVLEINPRHPIMLHLNEIRTTNPEVAELVAGQIYDNALIAAGILDDSRAMLPRLNNLMEKLLLANK